MDDAPQVSRFGTCEMGRRHDAHLLLSGTWQCYGQASDCRNCDDRKCMSCIFREIHNRCADDCPECCA